MERILDEERSNAAIAWAAVAVVLSVVAWTVLRGAAGWMLFGLGLIAVFLVVPVAQRSPTVMAPWPVALVAAAPFVAGVLAPAGPVTQVAAYLAVAAIALLVVVEIDAFTPVEMNRGFAVAFVVVTTMTVAGTWSLAQWLWDLVTGTSLVGDNDALMWELVAATGAGLVAAVAFDLYLRRMPGDEALPDDVDAADADGHVEAAGNVVSDLFERVGISDERQHHLVRAIQGVLGLVGLVGVVTLNVDVVFNAAVGLLATVLPALIEREYDLHLDVGLVLWIAVAVVLHAFGTLYFYQTVPGWHNLTHVVSGSLVAGVGYTVVRTLETHTDAVSFPPKFTLVFVVITVFAIGVVWEIMEFSLDQISAAVGTEEMLLAQHGLTDTMSDLLADTIGALVVAAGATLYRTRPEE